jgi:hypothetical protein
MISLKKSKGQGALEYLLLIGGAILIAVIVIALLVGMGNRNKDSVTDQTDKVNDALSTPLAVTINSANPVSCVGDDVLTVNITFSEPIAPPVEATTIYQATLLNGTNDAYIIATSVSGGIASGDNVVFTDTDVCLVESYSVIIDTTRTINGQSKYVSSMKYNFNYP